MAWKLKKPNNKVLFVSFLLAVFFHLMLVFSAFLPEFYRLWQQWFPKPENKQPTEVSMITLSKKQWNQNRQASNDIKINQKEQKNQPDEPEKEKEELKGQVVDLAPTENDAPPKDARYLSNYNTNVEKESVSRFQTKDYQVAQSRPTSKRASRQQSQSKPNDKPQDQIAMVMRQRGARNTAQNNQEKNLALEIPDIKKHDPLKLKLNETTGNMSSRKNKDPIKGNSEKMRLQLGLPRAEPKLKGLDGQDEQTIAMLQPSSMLQPDSLDGAPSNDHIRDAPKGDETLLNSREFRYATFFNRIKRGVSNNWKVGEVYFKHDPYGNVYGIKDRYTLLNVVLDTKGSLEDVSVMQSSGLGFLDDEAINAFRRAAPFPNPPEGLIETDGLIRFQFGFFFEISSRPMIRGFNHDYSRR